MNDATLPGADPLRTEALARFSALLAEAIASDDPEPTAMSLATAVDGRVSVRIVLLKGVDERGFRFFTNRASDKGRQLAAHPRAALCFHWKQLHGGMQVRIEGGVEQLPDAESDAYFASRPRGSQIGAWASLQSSPLPERAVFEARIAEMEARFAGGPVPRPPHWGGFLVRPERIEFWHAGDFRLHERVLYEALPAGWGKRLLYP